MTRGPQTCFPARPVAGRRSRLADDVTFCGLSAQARFSNNPYTTEQSSLDDYETHFTVMVSRELGLLPFGKWLLMRCSPDRPFLHKFTICSCMGCQMLLRPREGYLRSRTLPSLQ